MSLRKVEGEVGNPLLDGLKRLEQELNLRRVQNFGEENEQQILTKIHFSPMGLRSFVSSGILILGLSFTFAFSLRNKQIESLSKLDVDKIQFRHVENAFFFYKGEAFKKFKTEYRTKCQDGNLEYCRISQYFDYIDGNRSIASEQNCQ